MALGAGLLQISLDGLVDIDLAAQQTGGLDQQDDDQDQIHQEGSQVGQVHGTKGVGDTDDDAAQQGALDGAGTTDHDDDDGVEQNAPGGAGANAGHSTADQSGSTSDQRAQNEDAGEDQLVVDTQRSGDLTVVHTGTNHGADAGLILQQPQQDAHKAAESQHEDTDPGHHKRAHSKAADQPGGDGSGHGLTTPDPLGDVVQNVDNTDGQQNLVGGKLVEAAQEADLQNSTQSRADECADNDSQDPVSGFRVDPDAAVTCEHVDGTMRHVDHAHQAQGQRHAGSDDKQHQAVSNAHDQDAKLSHNQIHWLDCPLFLLIERLVFLFSSP